MHVKYALAYSIVDGNEGALRSESSFHRHRQKSGIGGELCEGGRRNIDQTLQMQAGNQQAMAGKKRTMIEKRDGLRILKDDAGGDTAAGDLTKGANAHAVLV